jgi:formylglycine-generating enzyme required for sulfatase activity
MRITLGLQLTARLGSPAGCDYRIVRGGSWVTYLGDLRSAERGRFAIDFRSNSLGFRVARALTR